SLNGRFLIPEDCCVLRCVQVETNDIGRLSFEIGIVAGHVALQWMWPHSRCSPNPMNCILADVQRLGEFTNRPVRVEPSFGLRRVASKTRAWSFVVITGRLQAR